MLTYHNEATYVLETILRVTPDTIDETLKKHQYDKLVVTIQSTDMDAALLYIYPRKTFAGYPD